MAEQSDCPRELTRSEWIEFGSLRAGHLLQMRNLYRVLEAGSLSFKNQSVVCLIIQSIWEAGPNISTFCINKWHKDSHYDLVDAQFSLQLGKILTKFLNTQKNNWKHPYNLLTVIMITLRILEMNSDENVADLFVDVLLKCRAVAKEWMESIEQVIKAFSNTEKNEILRNLLVKIAICSALTFSLDPTQNFYSKVLTASSVSTWILSLVKINNNIILGVKLKASFAKTEDPFLRNMMRIIRNTGIKLQSTINALLGTDNFKELNIFAADQWRGTNDDVSAIWQQQGSIFYKRTKDKNNIERCIQVDILLGHFLVDGNPVCRLGERIVSHPFYTRVFQKSVFEVLPEGTDSFLTMYKYGGCKYSFRYWNGTLNISERDTLTKNKYELVPHENLCDQVPHLLVVDYCHWWSRQKNIIEFRPLPFNLSGASPTNKVCDYILDLTTGLLTEQNSQKCIVDVMSESWKQITKYLSRFEKSEYMKIVCDSNNKATVELSRMRIQFHVSEKFELESHEYEGMRVSIDHKRKGTLLRLHNGLLLCNNSGYQKFLVPYGQCQAHIPTCGKHQKVAVNLDELRQPSFFIYEVDELMWQLKPGKSYAAIFYLAYLHAITAHPLDDPFTGMTGTERALQLLQSAHCWSSQPYDAESHYIMQNICKLTPERKKYCNVPGLETVKWPPFLPSAAAHEMFALIVMKLKFDSEQLKFLFPDLTSTPPRFNISLLNIKSFERNICYNPNSNVSQHFESVINLLRSRVDAQEHSVRSTKSSKGISEKTAKAIRSLAILEHELSYYLCDNVKDVLVNFLTHGSTLDGATGEDFFPLRIDQWESFDLKNNFLNLYIFAKEVTDKALRADWAFFLSYLAFCGNNLEILLILQAVSLNPTVFAGVNPPNIASYQDPTEIEVSEKRLNDIFESCAIQIDAYLLNNGWEQTTYVSRLFSSSYSSSVTVDLETHKENENKKILLIKQHVNEIKEESKILFSSIQQEWPCDECSFSNLDLESFKLINVKTVKSFADPLLRKWNQNRQLYEFLGNMIDVCRQLPLRYKTCPTPTSITNMCAQKQRFTNSKIRKTQLSFEYYLLQHLSKDPVVDLEADKIFTSGHIECPSVMAITPNTKVDDVNMEMLKQRYQFIRHKSQELWDIICDAKKNAEVGHLVHSGLYPRIIPSLMLQKLISPTKEENTLQNLTLNNLIGAWGVALTWEQQANRMIKFVENESLVHLLEKEVGAIPHVNWSPKKNPTWLVFEIEMNLIIRKVQVEVAQQMIIPQVEIKGQMINAPADKHSVMQLNMGEGKTAVIVPLLCLTLADGKDLCRVTVLKSLFRTNFASLRQCIGGITNRRIYAFPCRRDMPIEETEARTILGVYQECQKLKGIVMTLPEYTLSFQLKMYETYLKKDSVRSRRTPGTRISSGSQMLVTYKWLNQNVRDILDESDEILHAKYQLIYTVGRKLPPDGGELRWTVAQGLLKIVPKNMKILYDKHGVEHIEWDFECEKKKRKEIFTPCRILQEKVYGELIETLTEDFLNGRTSIKFVDLKDEDRKCVKEFLINKKTDEFTHGRVMEILNDSVLLDTILILSGYLKYEVLRAALGKRWRVNYGVHPAGKLKMAVPFKAKDVAAENTEFGHPDIAICLTLLSYYYSGLSDDQLMHCFEILERFSYASKIYDGWINKLEVDPSVQNYEGLVLEDIKNRDKYLFPLLRKNMYVIDFWLAETVFKHEVRQFECKMMTSAWDLCSEERKKKVTGFSGTNDSQNLLPATTLQNDLKQLEKTNEDVRKTLLRPENDDYQALDSNITDKMILSKLAANKIPVLLDSGALMLELNNEQVAEEWLKLITKRSSHNTNKNTSESKPESKSVNKIEIDAAIYFNEDNILMVKDRQNRNTELEFSPFRDRLERCVVYLDDAHTRGTDFKFPLNTKACVTLGGKITRDKTVQACMRMRMLGKGHSICFWASQEAHNSIRELCGHKYLIRTEEILSWIENNSKNFEKEGLVHWASAGINYAQKRAAHHLWDARDTEKLSENCCDDETIELMETYGKLKTETLYTDIIEHHFDRLIKTNSSLEILRIFDFHHMNDGTKKLLKTKRDVLNRLKKFIPDVKRYAQLLDEEQEKELQQEKEINVEVSKRPAKMFPADSQLDEDVKTFLKHGDRSWMNDTQKFHNFFKTSVLELPRALTKYGFENFVDASWGNCVYATKDYISVVQQMRSSSGLHFEYDDYFGSFNRSSYSRLLAVRQRESKLKKQNENNEITGAEFLRPVSWIACCHSHYLILLSPFEANEYLPLFRSNSAVSVLHMYSPRLKPKQNFLIDVPQLVIPSIPRMTPISGCRLAQLTLFSGGLYFQNQEEQNRYCEFTGFIPRPRSEKHNQDFESGCILNNGFVPFKNRHKVSQTILEQCKFRMNPEKLIRGIAESRHGYFPRSSHISLLVVESKDMTNDNTQE